MDYTSILKNAKKPGDIPEKAPDDYPHGQAGWDMVRDLRLQSIQYQQTPGGQFRQQAPGTSFGRDFSAGVLSGGWSSLASAMGTDAGGGDVDFSRAPGVDELIPLNSWLGPTLQQMMRNPQAFVDPSSFAAQGPPPNSNEDPLDVVGDALDRALGSMPGVDVLRSSGRPSLQGIQVFPGLRDIFDRVFRGSQGDGGTAPTVPTPTPPTPPAPPAPTSPPVVDPITVQRDPVNTAPVFDDRSIFDVLRGRDPDQIGTINTDLIEQAIRNLGLGQGSQPPGDPTPPGAGDAAGQGGASGQGDAGGSQGAPGEPVGDTRRRDDEGNPLFDITVFGGRGPTKGEDNEPAIVGDVTFQRDSIDGISGEGPMGIGNKIGDFFGDVDWGKLLGGAASSAAVYNIIGSGADQAARAAEFTPFNVNSPAGNVAATKGSLDATGNGDVFALLRQIAQGRLGDFSSTEQIRPDLTQGTSGLSPEILALLGGDRTAADNQRNIGTSFLNQGRATGDALRDFNPDAFALTQFERLNRLAAPGERTAARETADKLFSRGRLGSEDSLTGRVFRDLDLSQSLARDSRLLSAVGLAGNEADRLTNMTNTLTNLGGNLTGSAANRTTAFQNIENAGLQSVMDSTGFLNKLRTAGLDEAGSLIKFSGDSVDPLLRQLGLSINASSSASGGNATQAEIMANAGGDKADLVGGLLAEFLGQLFK